METFKDSLWIYFLLAFLTDDLNYFFVYDAQLDRNFVQLASFVWNIFFWMKYT